MENKRDYMRGLAEKTLKRINEEEAEKRQPGPGMHSMSKARAMAQYSGLTENACYQFVTQGRW